MRSLPHTFLAGFILLVGLAVGLLPALAAPPVHAAIVLDADRNIVLFEERATTPLPPASLTKMMTLYLVFEAIEAGRIDPDQPVVISARAAAEPPSRIGFKAGASVPLRDLVRGAAIHSANDCATALAETIAGSSEAFAVRMTQTAAALGMQQSRFLNAHGLTAKGHVSSVRDMAILAARLLHDFPQYYNLFGTRSTSVGGKTFRSTNYRLLDGFAGADGIKTGYTRPSGFNLAASAERGGRRLVVVVFGGRSAMERETEVESLLERGFATIGVTKQDAPSRPIRRLPEAPTQGRAEVPPRPRS